MRSRGDATQQAIDVVQSTGLPLPRSERTWGFGTLMAVGLTATIATWLFPIGAAVGYFLDAGRGTAVLFGGAMIGMFLVVAATVPAATRYGIDTIATTKPQFGNRGFGFAILLQYATVVGWNCLLIIILGRSVSSILVQLGVIQAGAGPVVAGIASAGGALLCWALLARGPGMVRDFSKPVAGVVVLLGLWMLAMLLLRTGTAEIGAAAPLAASGDTRWDFAAGLEIAIASMMAWWPYIGGIVRSGANARTASWAAMLALGIPVPLLAVVGLYAGLVYGDADPAVWMSQLGGPSMAIVALLFVIVANVGTTLVGIYIASLGLLQIESVQRRSRWGVLTGATVIPVAVISAFAAEPFMANVPTFLAFMGVLLGPVVGIQIADLLVIRRGQLDVRGLYREAGSPYRYLAGFNPAGFIAAAAGSAVYLYLLNPVTFSSRGPFALVTATVPSVVVGAVVYLLAYRAQVRFIGQRSEAAPAKRADPARV
jgi:NCS1 family nucleobase:cation symporter-1